MLALVLARPSPIVQGGPPAFARGLDLSVDARYVNFRPSTSGSPSGDPAFAGGHPRIPSTFLVTSKRDPWPSAAFGDRIAAGDLAQGDLAARGASGVAYYRCALPKGASKLLMVKGADLVLGWVLSFPDEDGSWFAGSYGRMRAAFGAPCQVGWKEGRFGASWIFGERTILGRQQVERTASMVRMEWGPPRGGGEVATVVACA